MSVFETVPAPDHPELLRLVGLILIVDTILPTPRFFDALLSLDPGSTRNQLSSLRPLFKVPDSDDGFIESLRRDMDQFFFSSAPSKTLGLYLDREKTKNDLLLLILKSSMKEDESISGVSKC